MQLNTAQYIPSSSLTPSHPLPHSLFQEPHSFFVLFFFVLFPNKQSSSGWQVQLYTKGRDPATKGERKITKKKNNYVRKNKRRNDSNRKNKQTRSSWLNCALRDDEAVYWVSSAHQGLELGGTDADPSQTH